MPPKKAQAQQQRAKQQAAAAAEDQKQQQEAQAPEGEAAAVTEQGKSQSQSPLLGKWSLIELNDGRQVCGELMAFDSNGTLLLGTSFERKKIESTAAKGTSYVYQRDLMALSVPTKHVAGFYQREDAPPELAERMAQLKKQHEAYQRAQAGLPPVEAEEAAAAAAAQQQVEDTKGAAPPAAAATSTKTID